MKRNRLFEFLLGFLALAFALGGAWYGRTAYLRNVTVVKLPVPVQDIGPYTLLTSDLLTLQEFPRALIEQTGGYATQPADLIGQITTSTLAASLPVPASLVVSSENFRLADPSLEVISIPISPENAVGGQLQIGEWVNVYRLDSEQGCEGSFGFAQDRTGEQESMGSFDFAQDEAGEQENKDVETLPSTLAPTPPCSPAQITLVATVPVVDIRAKDGSPVIADAAAETADGSPTATPEILVVAATPDVVQDILQALALKDVGKNQLWVTLAVVGEQ